MFQLQQALYFALIATNVVSFPSYSASLPNGIERAIAERVDEVALPTFPGERKLLNQRRLIKSSQDACTLDGSPFDRKTGISFFSSVHHGVNQGLVARKIFTNSIIDEAYGLPGRNRSLAVGLLSHPLCSMTRSSAEYILGTGFAPDSSALNKLNRFVDLSNAHRSAARSGNTLAHKKFELLWTTFFSCLAYKESLSDEEDSAELNAAYLEYLQKFPTIKAHFRAQQLENRSPGVHFGFDYPGEYYIRKRAILADTSLSESERRRKLENLEQEYSEIGNKKWVVAGMYQFTPSASGNVTPCVDQWNEVFQNSCPISKTTAPLAASLVYPAQSFNAFCGVQKVVQGFNSQVNTTHKTGVHPSNIVNGKLRSSASRCVSLLMRGGTGRMYTHFGPLRNSTQTNFSSLINCVDQSLLPELLQ